MTRCLICKAFIRRQPTMTSCKRCGALNIDTRNGTATNGLAWSTGHAVAMNTTIPARFAYKTTATLYRH